MSNKLQYDLLLNNISCLCCFSYKESEDKVCSHCLKEINIRFYKFKSEIKLGILQEDPDLPYTKVTFTANNTVKTGYIYMSLH